MDGAAATPEGYANLAGIAERVRARHGAHVSVRIVVPHRESPPALGGDSAVLLDPEGATHRRYGAGAECLYLVRPDGYVAFRSQPADGDALMQYLERIFVNGPGAV
jgi:hypothetical protein